MEYIQHFRENSISNDKSYVSKNIEHCDAMKVIYIYIFYVS